MNDSGLVLLHVFLFSVVESLVNCIQLLHFQKFLSNFSHHSQVPMTDAGADAAGGAPTGPPAPYEAFPKIGLVDISKKKKDIPHPPPKKLLNTYCTCIFCV